MKIKNSDRIQNEKSIRTPIYLKSRLGSQNRNISLDSQRFPVEIAMSIRSHSIDRSIRLYTNSGGGEGGSNYLNNRIVAPRAWLIGGKSFREFHVPGDPARTILVVGRDSWKLFRTSLVGRTSIEINGILAEQEHSAAGDIRRNIPYKTLLVPPLNGWRGRDEFHRLDWKIGRKFGDASLTKHKNNLRESCYNNLNLWSEEFRPYYNIVQIIFSNLF